MVRSVANNSPVLMWFRRDLRLCDNAALDAAAQGGRPVIPVFIHDDGVETLGAAPKWRLGLSVADLGARLEQRGSRLVCRRGPALEVLQSLIAETGAGAVYWSRLYDPASKARDTAVKAALRDKGIDAQGFPGHVLFEPWTVKTGSGGFYKVYSPFWRAVKDRDVPEPRPAPGRLAAPESWPASDDPALWRMGAAMRRGADVVAAHVAVGEAAATDRLADFLDRKLARYAQERDFPARDATSRLSENLSCGEISPAVVWHAAQRAWHEGCAGAEPFLKELVWREFAWHLMYHTPHIATRNWRATWDSFPWSQDESRPEVIAWKRGRTGVELVDAAMREMFVTGTMHNRARMVVASYLTKHLMTHWKIGMRWFEDCLVDWDPASNAMGWQWVAGPGPDAAPYFRIFNADTQLARFDPDRAYVRAWIAEGQAHPPATASSYFRAVPESWGLSANTPYPARPVVDHKAGRERALAAYEGRDF